MTKLTENQKENPLKTGGRAKGRRMIAQEITESDSFYSMTTEAQAVYLHLAVLADDEGFCNRARMILKMLNSKYESLKELESAGYIYIFPEYVIVIRHFHHMNTIDERRSAATEYRKEREQLIIEGNIYYRAQGGTQGSTQADSQVCSLKESNLKESNLKESNLKESNLIETKEGNVNSIDNILTRHELDTPPGTMRERVIAKTKERGQANNVL